MHFKERSFQQKSGIIGSIAFSALYIVALLVLRDPDFLLFIVPFPLSFVLYFIQIFPFFIGMAVGGHAVAWIFAEISTILFLAFIGYFTGQLIGFLTQKILKALKR